MTYIRFENYGKGAAPKVSISKIGRLSFNEMAEKKFGLSKYRFVSLLFDETEMTLEPLVCVKNASLVWEARSDLLNIQFKPQSGFYISIRAFLRFFQIEIKETAFYDVSKEKENFLVVDLNSKKIRQSRK